MDVSLHYQKLDTRATVLDNSAQFSEAEKVEAHLSMCLSLMSSFVNETKLAAVIACAMNQSTCSSIGLQFFLFLPELRPSAALGLFILSVLSE